MCTAVVLLYFTKFACKIGALEVNEYLWQSVSLLICVCGALEALNKIIIRLGLVSTVSAL